MSGRDFATMVSGAALVMLAVCACAAECISPEEPSLCISAVSWRNTSGHWTVQAAVEHTADEPRVDALPIASKWAYNIDFTIKKGGKRDSIKTIVTATAPPTRVGSDYTFYPGVGFYKLHLKMDTWVNAKEKCEEEGAHLCIINSEEEEKVVKEILEPHIEMDDYALIGFHDRYKEGQYLTVLGEPLDRIGYTRWEAGQPNDYGNAQDCGGVLPSGEINDIRCDIKHVFLCEQMLW